MNKDIKLKREEAKKNKLNEKDIYPPDYMEEPDPRYATKDDIGTIVNAITGIAKTVNDLVEKQANPIITTTDSGLPGTADLRKIKESTKIETIPKSPKPTEEEIAGGIEKIPVPPQWRKMVDELLGMDFGIDVVYPQSGSGFLFKIIVPTEKSNMSRDYKEFYKVDIRTKAINYNEGVDGIRKFCEGVKKNLERKAEN